MGRGDLALLLLRQSYRMNCVNPVQKNFGVAQVQPTAEDEKMKTPRQFIPQCLTRAINFVNLSLAP